MPEKQNRRLAAIMFTDIVGYTAMMHENESVAAALRLRHREVFVKEHERCHGEVLQYYGDGTLSIFKSAVEAVECAIAMQRFFQNDKEVSVPLRIGIHLGDIVFDDNDVYGDGVNLASRVESMGVPGCVLISDKLNFAVKNHASISTQSLGLFEFKNIKDPVEVFAVTNTGIKVPERSELKGKLKENKKSIAVLPFVNMSSDPENEYFSDGISEEILNALVRVEGLQVTARTSSFAFKGKNMDVREIGRQLEVAHILEGSVRKAGNRVRVTAQLVSAIDGNHFFSESYDRTLEDIFAVQDEIASKITNRLRQHLGEAQHNRPLVKAPTENIEAYELYLRGLFLFNQWGDRPSADAMPYLDKAIELEPDFAAPHQLLSICYLMMAFGGQLTWEAAAEKGLHHINRAMELKPDSPVSYYSLATFQTFFYWDWEGARKSCQKMLELGAGEAHFYHAMATYHCVRGDFDAAIDVEKIGLALDPLSVQLNFYLGVFYLWKGDHTTAMRHMDKVIEMVPNHRTAHEMKGYSLVLQGQCDEAIGIFQSIPEMGYRLHRSALLGIAYAKKGDREKAMEQLKILEAFENSPGKFAPFQNLYLLHAALGNIDLSFHYIEKALDMKMGDTMMFHIEPMLQFMSSDPRFEQLKQKIGVVDLPDIKVINQ